MVLSKEWRGVRPRTILIVEGNDHHRYLVEEKFRGAFRGAEIHGTQTATEASGLLPTRRWDLIVVDAELPNGGAGELLDLLAGEQPLATVAILMEEHSPELVEKARNLGAVEFLKKDRATLNELVSRVRGLMMVAKSLRRRLSGMGEVKGNLSFRDPLTRVYNRAYFEDTLKREASRANRYGHEFSLLIVDVDHFLNLKQSKGPVGGDRCLKRLASILTTSVRGGDVVARYAGDKFVILLSYCRPSDGVRCASRVLEQLKKGTMEGPFSVSIGIVHHRGVKKVARPDQIVAQAAQALARAKRNGGNCYTVAA